MQGREKTSGPNDQSPKSTKISKTKESQGGEVVWLLIELWIMWLVFVSEKWPSLKWTGASLKWMSGLSKLKSGTHFGTNKHHQSGFTPHSQPDQSNSLGPTQGQWHGSSNYPQIWSFSLSLDFLSVEQSLTSPRVHHRSLCFLWVQRGWLLSYLNLPRN